MKTLERSLSSWRKALLLLGLGTLALDAHADPSHLAHTPKGYSSGESAQHLGPRAQQYCQIHRRPKKRHQLSPLDKALAGARYDQIPSILKASCLDELERQGQVQGDGSIGGGPIFRKSSDGSIGGGPIFRRSPARNLGDGSIGGGPIFARCEVRHSRSDDGRLSYRLGLGEGEEITLILRPLQRNLPRQTPQAPQIADTVGFYFYAGC